jgi:hypothetical protein
MSRQEPGRRPRAAAVALCAALAVLAIFAACTPEGPDRGTAGADAPAAAASPAAAWQRCTKPEGGFSVEFPADWQTNDGSIMPACTLFDPEAITVPEASELPADIAVGITVQDVEYERVADGTFGVRVLSTEAWRVAGQPALRRLVEQTGEGLLDAGVRSWEYVVHWGDGRTLVAVSHDVGAPAFDIKRLVLDSMMARLRRL